MTVAKYRAVMLTKKGGPEVLQVVELPVEAPGPGQLRVRVLAAGAGATDVTMLGGSYPFAPKIPFVPGYEVAGTVDAIGAGVTGFELGQRVAALTVYGSFAEFLVREAEHFLPIPDGVSDRDAAAVILNYGTAWQMIHRVAKVRAGQTALVTGAAGGVGTAILQLLWLAGVATYGAASEKKHEILRSLGATPIDYRSGRVDRLVRAKEPQGVDYAFDAVGSEYRPVHWCAAEGWISRGVRILRRSRSSPQSGDVLQSLRWCAPPWASRRLLWNFCALPEGSQAVARGSAQDFRTARGKEDRPARHPHLPAS